MVALVSTAVRCVPHLVAQRRADVERGDLEARVVARAGDELDEVRPPRRIGAEGRIEVFDRPAGEHLGPQLALLGVLERRVDGDDRRRWPARGGCGRRGAPRGSRPGRAPAGVRRRARPRASRSSSAISTTPLTMASSSRMRRDDRAERGEAPGRDLHADGVAHDVLEAVGLVEHHDVVLGEQHAVAGDVQPVEVRVDDDDVGDRGAPAGLLGEARLAHRAAVGARALVAADRDRARHGVGRGDQSSSARSPVSVTAAQRRCGATSVRLAGAMPSSSS